MIRFARVVTLLALLPLAGCTITIDPGIEDVVMPKETLGGDYAAQPKAGEAAPGAMLGSSSENVTLQVDKAAWNKKLAQELSTRLGELGATVDAGPEVTISTMDYDYNQSGIYVKTHEIDLELEVVVGDFRKRYAGRGETASSSSNASWQAAGDAISKILADGEFLSAIKAQ